MSHPPQPGQYYGQSHGGYDQSSYPQSWGFPQQGSQYGVQGAPPYGQPGGFGGAPPRQKLGFWAGLSIGGGGAFLVAVVVFLVTGLLAPGFLHADGDSTASGKETRSGKETQQGEPRFDSAKAAMDEFLSRVNKGDSSGAMALLCEISTEAKNVRKYAGKDSRLTGRLDSNNPETYKSGEISGTVNGQNVGGGIISLYASTESGFCVDMFSVYIY